MSLSSPLETLFSDTSQLWDLDRLYKELAKSKQAPLSPTERVCLRGLLSGVNPTEIAPTLHRQTQGLRVDLTRGLYRHLETLTLEKVKNWRSPVVCLEKAGYRRLRHSVKMLNQPPSQSLEGFAMLEKSPSNPAQSSSLYDQDFYQWTQEMAIALRAGQVSALDWENLAEEIESLGKSDRRALQSRLVVLLLHLLKWKYQPEYRTGSWKATISEQRRRIRVLLEDSPSLRPYLLQWFEKCFEDSRRQASDETNQALDSFPQACPFLETEILDEEFLPD